MLVFVNDEGGRRMDGKGRDLLVDRELIWKCKIICVFKKFKKNLLKIKIKNCMFCDMLILKIIFKK
jgi:hypothetical protein